MLDYEYNNRVNYEIRLQNSTLEYSIREDKYLIIEHSFEMSQGIADKRNREMNYYIYDIKSKQFKHIGRIITSESFLLRSMSVKELYKFMQDDEFDEDMYNINNITYSSLDRLKDFLPHYQDEKNKLVSPTNELFESKMIDHNGEKFIIRENEIMRIEKDYLKENEVKLIEMLLEDKATLRRDFYDLFITNIKNRNNKVNNYDIFKIPKNNGSGEFRTIYSPEPKIKEICKLINHNFTRLVEIRIKKHDLDDNIIAYRPEKNILDNARIHQNNKYMIKMDIKSYFESCKMEYYEDLFKNTIAVKKITRSDMKEQYKLYRNELYELYKPTLEDTIFINGGLVIGNPVSSSLSNLVMVKVIRFIKNTLNTKDEKIDLSFYADDATFSSNDKNNEYFNKGYLKFLLELGFSKYNLDFEVKDSKTKFTHSHFRRVTGLRLNGSNQVTIDRKKYNSLRNTLFLIHKGTIKPNEIKGYDDLRTLLGEIEFYLYNDETNKFSKLLSKYNKAYEMIKEYSERGVVNNV